MESKFKAESAFIVCGDILVRKTGSRIAIFGRMAVIGCLIHADLIYEIIFLCVVIVQYLAQFLVFFYDLQNQYGIWLDGRVGIDEKLVDDKVEASFAVGLQNCGVIGLISVMVHVDMCFHSGDRSLMYGFGSWGVKLAIGGLFIFLGVDMLEEAFDAIVDFSKIFIAVSKLDWVSIDLEVSISIDDLAVVDLVGVVCFCEDVLHHRPGVYDALAHSVVLEGDQIVVFVVEAGGV